MPRRDPAPRLLNQRQAAAYCGLCVSNFIKACPVPPIRLCERIPRYDRRALDRWIDTLNENNLIRPDVDLEMMWDNGGNGSAGKGH